jgi:hypothetical protein
MITLSEVRQKRHWAASLKQRETVMKKKWTYGLVMQSEEKTRNVLETALYALFALSALLAIWQFADEPGMLASRPSITIENQAGA